MSNPQTFLFDTAASMCVVRDELGLLRESQAAAGAVRGSANGGA